LHFEIKFLLLSLVPGFSSYILNPQIPTMPPITIDIISDPVCIWCYIGYNRLQRAIQLFTKTHPAGRTSSFIIKWHPYYLNPKAKPGESITKREATEKKKGAECVNATFEKLKRVGIREGIKFDIEGRIGSTRDAHRLLAFTEQRGTQEILDRVVMGLFKGHFEEGKDVADLEWLAKVGSQAGLDERASRVVEQHSRWCGGRHGSTTESNFDNWGAQVHYSEQACP
jgi:predicted DsbA family dithiol-disulfide isomerase